MGLLNDVFKEQIPQIFCSGLSLLLPPLARYISEKNPQIKENSFVQDLGGLENVSYYFIIAIMLILILGIGLLEKKVVLIRRLRKSKNPLSVFEGHWIQLHQHTEEFAYCKIEYKNGDYTLRGIHYKNQCAFPFQSEHLIYEESRQRFIYIIEDERSGLSGTPKIDCYGYISFKHGTDNLEGLFIDILYPQDSNGIKQSGPSISEMQRTFQLHKLPSKVVARLNRKKMEDSSNKAIITEYFEKLLADDETIASYVRLPKSSPSDS